MRLSRWIWTLFAIGLLLGVMPVAIAETISPTQTIKGPVDDVIAMLRDPAFKGPGRKADQRAKIWQRIEVMFDFDEISRRTIGAKWDSFTADEQKRFADVFSKFLGNTYVEKLQGEYQDESITFGSELVKLPLALVRTKLVRQTSEIPIDYRMKMSDGQWLVYDILVENGVSLVKNYRVQFQSALQTESPAQLIKRLEDKLLEQQRILGNS